VSALHTNRAILFHRQRTRILRAVRARAKWGNIADKDVLLLFRLGQIQRAREKGLAADPPLARLSVSAAPLQNSSTAFENSHPAAIFPDQIEVAARPQRLGPLPE
jgi:hypothetical protein